MGRRTAGNLGGDAGGNGGRDQGGKERRRWAGAGAMEDGLGLRAAAWGPGWASHQQMGDLWGQG